MNECMNKDTLKCKLHSQIHNNRVKYYCETLVLQEHDCNYHP